MFQSLHFGCWISVAVLLKSPGAPRSYFLFQLKRGWRVLSAVSSKTECECPPRNNHAEWTEQSRIRWIAGQLLNDSAGNSILHEILSRTQKQPFLRCTDTYRAISRAFCAWRTGYLITSSRPSAIMNISLATSPFRQMRSPGVKINARIFSTKSWRNSGSHSWKIVTCQTITTCGEERHLSFSFSELDCLHVWWKNFWRCCREKWMAHAERHKTCAFCHICRNLGVRGENGFGEQRGKLKDMHSSWVRYTPSWESLNWHAGQSQFWVCQAAVPRNWCLLLPSFAPCNRNKSEWVCAWFVRVCNVGGLVVWECFQTRI